MKRHFITIFGLALVIASFFLLFGFGLSEIKVLRHERALGAFQKMALLNTVLANNNAEGPQAVSFLKDHIAFLGQSLIICDQSGIVTASNNDSLIGRHYQQLGMPVIKDSSVPAWGNNLALYVQPIIRRNQFVGYAGIVQDFGNLGSVAVAENRLFLLITMAVLLLLLLFCNRCVRRIIFQPIERLQKVVSECGLSDPLLNPSAPENNELSGLGRAIGQMSYQIKEDKIALSSAERVALAGRLASGIAHDVGNPLGVVQGYLTMLDGLEGAERQQIIGKMQKELDRITAAIHFLLDVSRPIVLQRRMTAIGPWLSGVLERVGKMARMSGVQLDFVNQLPDGYSFSLDEERVTAVLENILLNGADAMSGAENQGPKSLRILAKLQGGNLNISVTDNGPGLPPELFKQVFEPFFSTKPSNKGTGLGLYNAKQVIELHGGTITLQNMEKGGLCVAVLFIT